MSAAHAPERRQLTVLLCDLVGWTALAERLDAEDLADLVRAYRRRCTEVVERHGGMVAQYVGDAILAWFGYPHAHEDDAERAERAALEITAAERAAGAGTEVHIGVATGVVVVGDLLDEALRPRAGGVDPQGTAELSAVGSALNLAARLQSLAGPGQVVVSDRTQRLTRGIFDHEDLGRHALKGFAEPVQAWAALGERAVRSRFHALRAHELTPLVGRQAELAALAALWRSARDGAGRAVLIAAEPGAGKSRLVDEIARRVVAPDATCVWYYCSPQQQASPFAPVMRHLAFAAGFAAGDDDDARLDKLAALLPAGPRAAEDVSLVANLLSIRADQRYPPPALSPRRRKQRLLEALVGLLAHTAARRPALLVVEDLHWIDPSSEELLGLIVQRIAHMRVLALLTARPEYRPRWRNGGDLAEMPLQPLGRDDAFAMIEALCGERSLGAATVARIAERADGLPLFIEDLTRDVLESVAGHADEGPAADARSIAVPATLADALTARLDRLGAAKAVAQAGAAIGREFSRDLLAQVSGSADNDLDDALQQLVEAGLLVPRSDAPVRTYAFRHALVRDAAYSSLLRKARVALHAEIAGALAQQPAEERERHPEVLAYHYEAAGDVANAVRQLVDSARLSAARSGFAEAIAQLRHALRLLPEQPNTPDHARLALRAHRALGGIYAEFRGFSSAECGAAYAAALDLCRSLGDPPEVFSVLSGVGAFEITRANFARCRALGEECLALAARQDARAPFIMGHLLLGGTQLLTGEFASSRAHLEEALRLYDAEASPRRHGQVLYVQDQKTTGLAYLGLTLAVLGEIDAALAAGRTGIAHSRALRGPHTVNYALCYAAALHHFVRDTRTALRLATESLELSREQQFATWIGISQSIRGAALVALGEVAEGLDEIRAGVEAHQAVEAVTYGPFAMALLAEGLAAAARPDEALEVAGRALASVARTGERFYLAELRRLEGEVLFALGRVSEGEHALRDAVRIARAQGARLFALRSAVSLCRALGGGARRGAIDSLLAPACAGFPGGCETPDLLEARALLAG